MAKNNKLINSMREIARRNRQLNVEIATEDVTPYVYAGIAIALHRQCGWGHKRINNIFMESQRLWESYGGDMIDLCETETGIKIRNQAQAEREGLYVET